MGRESVVDVFAADVEAIRRIEAVPRILEVICCTTGLGFAAVARVTEDRWIACAVRDEIGFGLETGGELDVRTTICDEIRNTDRMVVIDDVTEDEAYCNHAAPRLYGFQSYISVPIHHRNGRFFGTLCAIGLQPARLQRPEVVSMFTLFADLIGFHIDANERLVESERALSDERQRAELRDQFIAVLGHDLRNPLAAIQTGARLLHTIPLDAKAARVASVIQNSAQRMAGLISNMLDFARGRLGGGLTLQPEEVADLETTLADIVAECRAAWPGRAIDTEFRFALPVRCDRARIGQLFSNLLGNALSHGDPEGPVSVRATSSERGFELSVANTGQPIPPDLIPRLFQPFARAADRSDQQGLGLGLYIASEIARAHGGTIDVASSEAETRFTFRMPA